MASSSQTHLTPACHKPGLRIAEEEVNHALDDGVMDCDGDRLNRHTRAKSANETYSKLQIRFAVAMNATTVEVGPYDTATKKVSCTAATIMALTTLGIFLDGVLVFLLIYIRAKFSSSRIRNESSLGFIRGKA